MRISDWSSDVCSSDLRSAHTSSSERPNGCAWPAFRIAKQRSWSFPAAPRATRTRPRTSASQRSAWRHKRQHRQTRLPNMTISRSARCFGAAFILVVAAAIAAACWLFWPAQREAAPPIDSVHASAERGRYLATIGNCTSCHTARDGKPFAGGVSFHTPFGVMYSTNITPDPKTGIGQWSFDDFYQAMKHGLRPDGESLYHAFPSTRSEEHTSELQSIIHIS